MEKEALTHRIIYEISWLKWVSFQLIVHLLNILYFPYCDRSLYKEKQVKL